MYSFEQKIPTKVLAPTDEVIQKERQKQMEAIRQFRQKVGNLEKAPSVFEPSAGDRPTARV